MYYEEVRAEVARIINEQLDAGNDVINIAGLVLDFLDGIGYDNAEPNDVEVPY